MPLIKADATIANAIDDLYDNKSQINNTIFQSTVEKLYQIYNRLSSPDTDFDEKINKEDEIEGLKQIYSELLQVSEKLNSEKLKKEIIEKGGVIINNILKKLKEPPLNHAVLLKLSRKAAQEDSPRSLTDFGRLMAAILDSELSDLVQIEGNKGLLAKLGRVLSYKEGEDSQKSYDDLIALLNEMQTMIEEKNEVSEQLENINGCIRDILVGEVIIGLTLR